MARQQVASPVEPSVPVARRRRRWTWTLGAAVLIVIGSLLAPVAILANWTQLELSSTAQFVGTFAPLAKDPQVQRFLATQTTAVIVEKADIDGLTQRLVDGVQTLGLPPRADAALDSLGSLAAQSAKAAVASTVTKFVRSAAFAKVFEGVLRTAHTQLVATLRGGSNAVVSLAKGEVSVQLGPIVAGVKAAMVKQGLAFASAIPTVSKSVVLVRSAQLATAQTFYAVAVTVGTWAPWVVLALLVGGVLLALKRRIALIWAASAVAFLAILTLIALDVGKIVTVQQIAATVVPPAVAEVVFGQVTAYTRNALIAVAFVGILLALAAWFGRATGVPARLRAFGGTLTASGRAAAERQGLSTGAFGAWLFVARRVIRIVLAAIGVLVVLFVRPLTVEVIVTTSLLLLVALLLLELLQRPHLASPLRSETSA